jgi:hypothetical protein
MTLQTQANNLTQPGVGALGQNIQQRKKIGRGPDIWLAGDPEDLAKWIDFGAAGIVTNTVVLNQMVKKYGHIK